MARSLFARLLHIFSAETLSHQVLLLSRLGCLLQFSIRQGLTGLAVLLGNAETRETLLPSPQLDVSQQPEQTNFLADICKWVAKLESLRPPALLLPQAPIRKVLQ